MPFDNFMLRRINWLLIGMVALFFLVWLTPPLQALRGVDVMPLPVHNAVETFAIVIAMMVFGIAWNAYGADRPGNTLIIACGFLAVGMVDFGHTLSFNGMPDFVTPSGSEKAIQFWLSGSFLTALTLLVVALRSWQPLAKPQARYGLLAGSLAVTVIIYWLVLFHEQDWPHTFIEGEGLTPFKIEAELFIVALLLVPAVLFYRQAQQRQTPFRAFDAANLFAAAVILILNELCFTLFSAMGDIFNLLGHLYKIAAYVFIYRAVFVESVREPYLLLRREIEERKQAEQHLEESRAQLRGMTARREEAREEERKYIAREVHDELGQILTGLQLNVSVITHKFAADSPELHQHLLETMTLTNSALDATRNIASALRPAALDMGIASALEWLAGRFGTNTGIRCEVHFAETEIDLDESHAVALFRIVQESLTNVARHAKADRIDITLFREGDAYVLKVRDNGAGFDSSVIKENSFGLVGIRERALLLAGTVSINSQPGLGTQIMVRIPINNNSRKL